MYYIKNAPETLPLPEIFENMRFPLPEIFENMRFPLPLSLRAPNGSHKQIYPWSILPTGDISNQLKYPLTTTLFLPFTYSISKSYA
jgi:hypothetical protein